MMTQWLRCDVLDRNEVRTNLSFLFNISVKRLRKTAKIRSHDGQPLGQFSEGSLSNYKSEALLLQPLWCAFTKQNNQTKRMSYCRSLLASWNLLVAIFVRFTSVVCKDTNVLFFHVFQTVTHMKYFSCTSFADKIGKKTCWLSFAVVKWNVSSPKCE